MPAYQPYIPGQRLTPLPKKKKKESDAPVKAVEPVKMAANVKPPSSQSGTPNRATLVSAGMVANDESRKRAQGYDAQEGSREKTPPKTMMDRVNQLRPEIKEGMKNKIAMDKAPTGAPVIAQAPDTIKERTNEKTGKKEKYRVQNFNTVDDDGGKVKINRLTGLPFGYQPGDKLPAGADTAMANRADQSVRRQTQVTNQEIQRRASEPQKSPGESMMAANVKPTAPAKAPREGSLEAYDAEVARAKATAKADVGKLMKTAEDNAAKWSAGDALIKQDQARMKENFQKQEAAKMANNTAQPKDAAQPYDTMMEKRKKFGAGSRRI